MNDKTLPFKSDHYYDYQELSDTLSDWAETYPDLATLHAIGESHQGRTIWLMELTNQETGAGDTKPGYYIDANTHAEELTGSMVALYTIAYLLSQYGEDAMATRLLDTQTFYIIPRLDPDGAEICLTEPFYEWIGNGLYMPGEEQFGAGLHYEDVNGDDVIVDMRLRDDENGEWKISEKDPRLMVQREPYEFGGEYYRIVPEGTYEDFDGADLNQIPKPQEGNLNRNYPYGWGPEGEQYGAGQYPMSEPEVRAAAKFVLDHPNIVGAVNYHTNAGILIRALNIGGEPIPFQDDALFQAIGEIGEQETGYHMLTKDDTFHFGGHKPRMGTATAFLYGQLGTINFVTELWDVFTEAGIEKDWYFPLREHPEADKLKLLKWNDEQLDGEGFMEWTPFEHPQLGPVEIGGWKRLFMFRNPPAHLLEEICHKNMMFTLKHALTAPLVRVAELEATPLADGVFRVEAVVENQGYLPTHVTQRAIDMDVAEPVTVEIELPEGVELASGRQRVELGHLAGRSERRMKYSRFIDWHASAKKVQWVLQLPAGSPVQIAVRAGCPRGGEDTQKITLS